MNIYLFRKKWLGVSIYCGSGGYRGVRTCAVELGDIKLLGLFEVVSIGLQMISTALMSPWFPYLPHIRVTLLLSIRRT